MSITDITPRIAARDGVAVTIYTQRTCPTCPAVIRMIRDRGYDPAIVRVDQDQSAFRYIVQLGYQQVPVVYVSTPAGDVHWSGRRPDQVIAHLPKREAVA